METNLKTMQSKLNQIKALLGMKLDFAEAQLVDGTKIGTDAESFADGSLVYVMGEDGEKIPLPTGEYEMSDGTMMNVVDGEIKAKEEPEEAKKDEKEEEEMSTDDEATTEEAKEEVDMSSYALKSDLVDSFEVVFTKIAELEAKLQEFESVKEELSKVKKMSASKPMKHTMSTKQIVDEKKAFTELKSSDRVFAIFNKIKNN